MNQPNSNGTLILVLGILGLALSILSPLIGLIIGLIAWSMGDTSLKRLKEAGIQDGVDRNNVVIGRNCGAIAAFLFLGRMLLIWALSSR